MATNNYFGFTHGGTQYGTTGAAAAYQTAQPGYTVGHTAATPGTYTQQRAAGYDASAYQATAATHTTAGTYAAGFAPGTASAPAGTTYDYGYPRSAAATYDGSKTYYQQPTPAAAAAAAAATYSAAEAPYQSGATVASKPAYSTTSTYSAASRPVTQTTQKAATSYSSGYSAPPTTSNYTGNYAAAAAAAASQANAAAAAAASTKATTYTGYDAALYSAATMYVQQQAQSTPSAATVAKPPSTAWQSYKKGGMGGGGGNAGSGGMQSKSMKPKQPPKPQQLHYCDVCKISCAGPQTYREHLEGQKHKKKEAALKTGTTTVPRGGSALRCELCDVTCTGSDAYAAHIRGAKHQKVVKLHTKLGKPIPSTEPQIIAGNAKSTTTTAGGGNGFSPMSSGVGLPGAALDDKADSKDDLKAPLGSSLITGAGAGEELLKLEEKEIQPVGQDYIEEIKNEEGKVISFNCKLCECRFNDPNAKEMHMKGRRHRLQYKKKVNPDLVVDLKPSLRQRRIQEEKLRRQQMREEFWRRREEERMMEEEERLYWEERRRYEEEMEYYEWYRRYGCSPRAMPPPPRPFGPGMTPPMYFPQPMRRPDSSDDRHVVAKHAEIYPKEEELQAIQKIVSNTEKALKLVSDHIADVDTPKTAAGPDVTPAAPPAPKVIAKQEPAKKEPVKEGEEKKDDKEKDGAVVEKKEEVPQPPRMLKGVMRVGVLAKGLLLHGDLNVHLVVLCAEKPTRRLLDRVADNLPKQLSSVAAEEKYDLKKCPAEAAVTVTAQKEPHISVTITLTSPVMREQLLLQEGGDAQSQAQVKDPPDVLDRQKCLDALAALRHAKWFQARAAGLQSCVMVIRILRDLCQRVPTWGPLNSWAMELLAEKVISSGGQPLTPGDALRRVFEALASGILLPGGPGLLDPCEKDPTDTAAVLSSQEREDITASAQHALRLIAFRQIHKVLGMDPLPPPKFIRGRFNRKRRRDNSSGEGNDSEGEDEEHWPQRKHLSMSGDGKKDKKEDGGGETEKMETEKSEVGTPPK